MTKTFSIHSERGGRGHEKRRRAPIFGRIWLAACLLLCSLAPAGAQAADDAAFRVLMFTRTGGFRHDSIPVAQQVVRQLAAEHGFHVTVTEDGSLFSDESLAQFDSVMFVNTTGNVLTPGQKEAFERYIAQGGGFVGVHAASDTEYQWPFYGGLVGAYFRAHPPGTQRAEVIVEDPAHPSTAHLGESFVIEDEWYFFDRNPRAGVRVLARLNVDSLGLPGWGAPGADHPIVWCHHYEGGRSWYTGLGHRREVWRDARFQQMLLGGILWAAGRAEGSCSVETVDIRHEVLVAGMNEPMALDVADDGRVFWVERPGRVYMWEEGAGSTVLLSLNVYTEHEHGLLGIALDPDFASNSFVYLYYSPRGETVNRLSRFELKENEDGRPFLDAATERTLLTVQTDRGTCCHQAGDIEFGLDGKLYLSTGDNTDPFQSDGYAPIDGRPGREWFDARRTSQNPMDLRGKILRLNPDGSVPDDNPFVGDPGFRPEIWALGFRNPFRFSVHPRTGWLMVGDVGPDAGAPTSRGPAGYDEWTVVASGGQNHGWPHCIGPNQAYSQFDFGTGRIGEPYNCSGMTPAVIWYAYHWMAQFPELGAGGRTALGGPVYREPGKDAPYRLPSEYVGKWFIMEWSRNFIKTVTLNVDGTKALAIEDFLGGLARPIDMKQAPDGSLYILEYGSGWMQPNRDARLSRVRNYGASK